jgi:hypothetical protein
MLNSQQGGGSVIGQLRCSGKGLRDLVPADVNNPG